MLLRKRLNHERLIVYQYALDFVALALQLIEKIPKGHSQLSDQFRRACMSVPLNIAEASGKPSKLDGARFFAIARGSALECGAIVDVCKVIGMLSEAEAEEIKEKLVPIVAMLSTLCR